MGEEVEAQRVLPSVLEASPPRFVSLEKLKSASYLNPWNPLGISNQIIKPAERAHEEICRETRPSPRPRSAKEMDNRINIEARGRGRDFFRFDLFCKRARLRIKLSSGTLRRIIRLEAGGDASKVDGQTWRDSVSLVYILNSIFYFVVL